jgi:hypothetical protein
MMIRFFFGSCETGETAMVHTVSDTDILGPKAHEHRESRPSYPMPFC